MQKRNEERKECEEKKKKKVKGDQHTKGCESQIFKSSFRSILKRSCTETWRDYKIL